ncbi:MAG: hypothetical protein H0T79_21475 [Deltaproteobacteria bacterium]|nr:hypothetical protein [Deltaproteobacteria bacterium]
MHRAVVIALLGVLGVLGVALASSAALADPVPHGVAPHAAADPVRPRAAMADYFAGEQRGGYVLVGLGVGGLVAGGLLYRRGSPTARGAAYPLLGIGVLHLAAGIFIAVSSSGRVATFGPEIEQDAGGFIARERPRMAGVATQFLVLKIVEVVIAAGGLTMAGIGHRTDRPRLKGAGLALALEMAITFGFDVIAARRASGYRDELATLASEPSARSGASDVPIAMFSHAVQF